MGVAGVGSVRCGARVECGCAWARAVSARRGAGRRDYGTRRRTRSAVGGEAPVKVMVLAVVLLAAIVASVSLGEIAVPPLEVLRSLLLGGGEYDLVVRELRWPRTLLAAVSGAAFAIGGALIQSVTRNPLASPDIIGITQGAGLAATIALTTGAFAVAPAAMAGGLLAAATIFAFGGAQTSRRFVLAG